MSDSGVIFLISFFILLAIFGPNKKKRAQKRPSALGAFVSAMSEESNRKRGCGRSHSFDGSSGGYDFQADHDRRQAQRQADYLEYQARQASHYNSGSAHAQNMNNYARNARQNADRMGR